MVSKLSKKLKQCGTYLKANHIVVLLICQILACVLVLGVNIRDCIHSLNVSRSVSHEIDPDIESPSSAIQKNVTNTLIADPAEEPEETQLAITLNEEYEEATVEPVEFATPSSAYTEVQKAEEYLVAREAAQENVVQYQAPVTYEDYEEPEYEETYYEEPATEYTGSGTGLSYLGSYELTAYEWTGNPCANGNYPTEGFTVASNSIPQGTRIYIEGLGEYVVEDTGGMAGNVIDIYMGDYSTCMEFGRQIGEVYIIE